MFALVSSRYERASMIVTSNKSFSAWCRCSSNNAGGCASKSVGVWAIVSAHWRCRSSPAGSGRDAGLAFRPPGCRADLCSAFDRVPFSSLPAGDHVVALERLTATSTVRMNEPTGPVGSMFSSSTRGVCRAPGCAARRRSLPDVADKRLSLQHAIPSVSPLSMCSMAPRRLGRSWGATGLVLIDVPGRDLHASVLCPTGDKPLCTVGGM
jgi:hypothetical protein